MEAFDLSAAVPSPAESDGAPEQRRPPVRAPAAPESTAAIASEGLIVQGRTHARCDWSHLVIANGKLYLRDQDVLLCYDVRAK